jgi:hypothetical protein
MALNDTSKNYMLNQLGSQIAYVALLTADSSGAEISGGSPAYARKAITWNSASSGNLDSSNTPVFDVPGGVTITHIGFFSALTGGTYYGSSPLSASETFGSQGQFELQDADINLS